MNGKFNQRQSNEKGWNFESTVSKLGRSQFEEASEVLARAFCDDPVVCSILRGLEPEERLSRLKLVFKLNLKAIGPKRLLLCIKKGNNISGVAVLYPPGTFPLPLFNQLYILINAILRKGFYGLGRWMEWQQSIQKRHPKDRHYYLEFIGVDPPYQGKSQGSSILTKIGNLADRQHVGCYLETANPINLPLYHRFGFKIIDEEEVIGVPTWFMMRPPAE